jgi:hypothetical protein
VRKKYVLENKIFELVRNRLFRLQNVYEKGGDNTAILRRFQQQRGTMNVKLKFFLRYIGLQLYGRKFDVNKKTNKKNVH